MNDTQTQAVPDGDGDLDTELSVGDILRRTREHYGQSVRDVELAIRVRASQIQAIESDHTEELPGRVYAIGFVRSYAEYLGLDGDKMVELFKAQQGTKPKVPDLEFPVGASESRVPPIWLIVLSVIVTLSAFVLVGVFWGNDKEASSPRVPDVPEHLQKQTKSIIDFGDAEKMGDAPQSTDKQAEIFINVTQDSWVEIKQVSGEVLISRVLEAGEQYYIPNSPDLLMTLSNAGGVTFDKGEGVFVTFGAVGEAMENIPLDLEHLEAYLLERKTESESKLKNSGVLDKFKKSDQK